jgi:hypothetical protein
LPPLRERPADIPPLVRHFTQRFARRMGRQIEIIPSAVGYDRRASRTLSKDRVKWLRGNRPDSIPYLFRIMSNEILEDDAEALQLRFYAYLGLVGVPPGGEEERQEQARFDSEDRGYKAALLSTLARTWTHRPFWSERPQSGDFRTRPCTPDTVGGVGWHHYGLWLQAECVLP